jgi:hypothetical protein
MDKKQITREFKFRNEIEFSNKVIDLDIICVVGEKEENTRVSLSFSFNFWFCKFTKIKNK